jgi:hypothetical protein
VTPDTHVAQEPRDVGRAAPWPVPVAATGTGAYLGVSRATGEHATGGWV